MRKDDKQIVMSYDSYLELQKKIDDMNVELEKRSKTIAELQEKVSRNIEQYVKDNNDAIVIIKESVKKKLFDTESISLDLLSDERFISFVTGTNAFINEDTSVEDKAKLLANILHNIAFEQDDFSYDYAI